MRYIGLLVLLLGSASLYAQLDLRLNKKFGFKDYCFDKDIKTILLFREGNELSEPILELGSSDVLTVMFDDLNEDGRSLYYTIVHCDADWNEDNTFQNDYMTGFTQNRIRDYDYSVNTRVPYQHYKFTIPNADISLKISGNYMLKVYDSSDSDVPLFQKGFSIVEPIVGLTLRYENLTHRGFKGEQQLNFSVSYAGQNVVDPSRDFKIRVEQNGHRMPNAALPTPTYVKGTTADYSQFNKNIYEGGNEFRPFDLRTLEFAGQGVSLVELKSNQYHVLLNDAEVRAGKPYLYERELNGKYYIDYRTKFGDKHTEADYVQVYFTLPQFEPFANATLYVYGGLTDWSIYDRCAMVYSQERGAYELTLMLKQGLYNYEIVTVNSNEKFDAGLVEGNFSETENSYNVYVYYRSPRDRWDRLVAVEGINTLNQKSGSFSGVISF